MKPPRLDVSPFLSKQQLFKDRGHKGGCVCMFMHTYVHTSVCSCLCVGDVCVGLLVWNHQEGAEASGLMVSEVSSTRCPALPVPSSFL